MSNSVNFQALVSVVTVVVVLAFCLVGTEEQTEPTVAKKFLSTTRQTMRKFKKDSSQPLNPVQIKIGMIVNHICLKV